MAVDLSHHINICRWSVVAHAQVDFFPYSGGTGYISLCQLLIKRRNLFGNESEIDINLDREVRKRKFTSADKLS